jgi:hypothetical protein
MAGLSDWAENGLLDWWFRNQTFTIPATCYWRLYTANPNFETGSGGTELTGGTGYTTGGQGVTMSGWWTVATQGANGGYRLTNSGSITWTASADWTAITGVALWDNSTGGNMILGGAWAADPGNGDTVRIAAGAIDIDFDVTAKAGVTSYSNQQMAKKLGANTPDAPLTAQFVALYTTSPDIKDPIGTPGTEVSTSGTAYARADLTPASGWDASSGGAIANAAQIDWAAATASWGTVLAAAIVDTDTPSAITKVLALDTFTGVVMDNGDDFYIADGAFDITLD